MLFHSYGARSSLGPRMADSLCNTLSNGINYTIYTTITLFRSSSKNRATLRPLLPLSRSVINSICPSKIYTFRGCCSISQCFNIDISRPRPGCLDYIWVFMNNKALNCLSFVINPSISVHWMQRFHWLADLVLSVSFHSCDPISSAILLASSLNYLFLAFVANEHPTPS
jgi:hypothetical protein